MACPSGVIGAYLHASPGPGLGKMGALVALADKGGTRLEGSTAEKVQVGLLAPCSGHSFCTIPGIQLLGFTLGRWFSPNPSLSWCVVVKKITRGAGKAGSLMT
jgi:hypothetical protein